MRKLLLLICFIISSTIFAQNNILNELLQKHVDNKGNVNYTAFKKDVKKLKQFTDYLNNTTPKKTWSKEKQMAFWTNAYNAYTILLVLHEYPLKSITDIKEKGKNAWNIPFAKIGGKTYTLDHIEHQILRKKFFDPRIHVAVNCASASCPRLLNKAFTEKNINKELTVLMTEFVNDSSRNKISENNIQISKIFEWFKGDFTKNGSLIDFLNKYSSIEISKKATISYLKYNWNLNKK